MDADTLARRQPGAPLMTNLSTALQTVYVGCYTHSGVDTFGRVDGIYVYDFDPSAGELRFRHATAGIVNPSYLALSADRRTLYAVNELEGAPGGISALALDSAAGAPLLLNTQPVHGTAPCYICLDPSGKWALVANYGSGNVTVLPILADGQLGAAASIYQSRGCGADPKRQATPHAHCAVFDPAGRHLFVADLGVDCLLSFHFDDATGQLIPADPSGVASAPGAGPRHLVFSADARYLYAVNELDSTVAVYAYAAATGTLTPVQVISTLPDGFSGESWAGGIQIAPSGRFLYASNRGDDSIAVFAIDAPSGRLARVEIAPCGGRWPRHIAFDRTGDYLLVANQRSEQVVILRADPDAGTLTPAGEVAVSNPAFVIAI